MKVKNHWSLQTHQRDDVVGDDASKQSLHCVFLWEKTNKTHQSIQQLLMLLNTWNKLSFFYSFCFIFVSSTCFFFLLKLNRKHVVGSFYSYKVLYLERLLGSLTNCKIKLLSRRCVKSCCWSDWSEAPCVYQLLGHLLDLGDEVGEELGHVLLLAGVQRLFVHRVGFTEGSRVVGFPLALLNTTTERGRQERV